VIDCNRRDYSTIDRDHDRDRAQPYTRSPTNISILQFGTMYVPLYNDIYTVGCKQKWVVSK